ncbi:MAG: formylglycine-generating enzyme family protein [Deltaproteobacteria bacterium]|nr:formylglycine-generating enzyme family protein [Deltaproteobacteria bacterium]
MRPIINKNDRLVFNSLSSSSELNFKKRLILLGMFTLFSLMVSGCATMFANQHSMIEINSEKNEQVQVQIHSPFGNTFDSFTPLKIYVPSPFLSNEFTLKITDPCYRKEEIQINEIFKGIAFLNIYNMFYGFFVDLITGALWQYPENVTIKINKIGDDCINAAKSQLASWNQISFVDLSIRDRSFNIHRAKKCSDYKLAELIIKGVSQNTIDILCLKKQPGELDYEKMVYIPEGEFEVGSSEHSSSRPVHIAFLRGFYIDKYEVSVRDYQRCFAEGGCTVPRDDYRFNGNDPDQLNHPINGVSWYDANDYCWHVGKRLPSDAEWERAASYRDGAKYRFASGKDELNCVDAVIRENGNGCGINSTWEVGSKSQEINGTFDMAGNVKEWVNDWMYFYSEEMVSNPIGPENGSKKIVRGSGWFENWFISLLKSDSDYQSTYRDFYEPKTRSMEIGFRCATFQQDQPKGTD